MPHLTPFSTPTPKRITQNFMERQVGLFWQSFKTYIRFEQKIHVRILFGLCILIPELLYFVLYYLVPLASGEVFPIHEKLISGVVHAHNPVVFP